MSKIPGLSSKEVIKAVRAAGFEDAPKKGQGSHIALMKRDPKSVRLVIVLKRKSFLTHYRAAGTVISAPCHLVETFQTC